MSRAWLVVALTVASIAAQVPSYVPAIARAIPAAAFAADTLDQSAAPTGITGDFDLIGGDSSPVYQWAQTVTVGKAGPLTRVRVPIGCPSGATLRIEIQALQDGGIPNPDALLTSRTLTGVADDITMKDVVFSEPVSFDVGQRFAIVAMEQSSDDSRRCRWQRADGNVYDGGNRALKPSDGAWDGVSGDFGFETYVNTAVSGIAGIATCNGDTRLYGAKVELYSGSARVATTTSDSETATYLFEGVAPNATFTIHISKFFPPFEGESGGFTESCAAVTTTDDSGSSIVPTGVSFTNHRNHVWPAALDMSDPLKGATTVAPGDWRIDDYVFQQGQSTWFKVPVRQSQRVLVKVTNVPANYSVALYKDISKLYAQQLAALTGTTAQRLEAIARLDASVAPDALSPDELSPDALSPDELSPDALSPDALSPDALSPDELSPDELSPDELSPDALSPDALSPDELSPDALSPDALSSAYAGAQTAALIGVSAHVGLSPEQIARNTWDNAGYFYVRVRGHNGAFDAARPFSLEIKVTDVGCTGVTLTDTPLAGLIASTGRKTLILTNTAQFPVGTDTAALMTKLNSFAARSDIAGAVIDLNAVAGVATAYGIWNAARDCPAAANIVARRIKDVIDAYRAANASFAYVVLAGNDHVVPFFRIPDQSGLGSEKDYRPAVQDPTASQASLRFGYVLTQDFYGSKAPISRFDHELYVPDLAVGRLVETVADMSTMIDAYTAANGAVAPSRAIVTGYDFLADTAGFVADQLAANGLTTDRQLIQPVGESPTGPNAWTAAQLRAKLFGATTFGILSLNSHFSGNSMLAADFATRMLSNEITGLSASDLRFRNALILSTGCHSGYNIVDGEATALTQPIDWVQAFASRGATVIGGTGYQYGDTDFMKYSEQILANTTLELRYGSGPIAIGAALATAKRTYLSSLVSMKGIDEKALAEVTLYGLPMLGYNLPSAGRIVRPPATNSLTLTGLTSAGLSYADLTPTYALHPNTRSLTVAGSSPTAAIYYDINGNVAVAPGSPVLPLTQNNVAIAGQAVRGAVLMNADYTDQSPITPFTDVATTEVRGIHPRNVTDVFTPVRPFDLNQMAASTLLTTPFQFRSLNGGTTGVGRRFTAESFRLYYSTLTDARALAAAPVVYAAALTPSTDPTKVDVSVAVGALEAVGVEEVWVTYTGETGNLSGHWASLRLTRDSSSGNGIGTAYRYSGSIPRGTTPVSDARAFIQAVGGNGLVTWASNDGAYFRVVNETATAADPKISTSLSLVVPTSGAYRSTVTVRARLLAGGSALSAHRVSFRSGGTRVDATTAADGWATAQLRLMSAPGTAEVSVGFEEDLDYLGSGAQSSVLVTRAASTLTPVDGSPVQVGGSLVVATLRGGGETLGSLLVTLSGGGKTAQTFTDGYGRVRVDTNDGFPTGAYQLTVTFDGNDRYLPADASSSLIVVYDTSTSVTAGGWFNTPADSIGFVPGKKTNFGGNVKYKNGTTTPTGNLEFQAKESGVTLKATSFDWLAISGSTAEAQGSGTLNGVAGWSFRIVLVDGGGNDRFTITIWRDGVSSYASPSYRASAATGGGNIGVR